MNRLEPHILTALESDQKAALATIVSLSGSAPRTPGTRMMIRHDGSIVGTIGGGRLEADVIRAGLETLRTGKSLLHRFTLESTDAKDMDMICGGVLDVLVQPFADNEQTLSFLRIFCGLLEKGQSVLLGTILREDRQGMVSEQFVVQKTAGGWVVLPQLPQDLSDLSALLDRAATEQGPTLFRIQGLQIILEPVGSAHTVHVFGAGHVSREVAWLAHRFDFRVEVYDDRAEYANAARFPHADAVHVPVNLATAVDAGRITDKSFVVIVTRGHAYDMDVLDRVLQTKAGYIGMIGSRRKRDAIYTALRERGYSQAELDGVHCPIGLDIQAETPAEIALSIVAELVLKRAEQRAKHDC
jgi:xanthine dehydrogenase accessory factor